MIDLTFEENFLKLIAKEYYKLIGEETKRLDPCPYFW